MLLLLLRRLLLLLLLLLLRALRHRFSSPPPVNVALLKRRLKSFPLHRPPLLRVLLRVVRLVGLGLRSPTPPPTCDDRRGVHS